MKAYFVHDIVKIIFDKKEKDTPFKKDKEYAGVKTIFCSYFEHESIFKGHPWVAVPAGGRGAAVGRQPGRRVEVSR